MRPTPTCEVLLAFPDGFLDAGASDSDSSGARGSEASEVRLWSEEWNLLFPLENYA